MSLQWVTGYFHICLDFGAAAAGLIPQALARGRFTCQAWPRSGGYASVAAAVEVGA